MPSEDTVEEVKRMSLTADGKSAVFDIPSKFAQVSRESGCASLHCSCVRGSNQAHSTSNYRRRQGDCLWMFPQGCFYYLALFCCACGSNEPPAGCI